MRITVFVDGVPRRLFLGLRVRHAIGPAMARCVERGGAVVVDDQGNQVDLDGALHEGERLYLKRTLPGRSPATCC